MHPALSIVTLGLALMAVSTGAVHAAPSAGVSQATRDKAARFLRGYRSTPRRLETALAKTDHSQEVNLGRTAIKSFEVKWVHDELGESIKEARAGGVPKRYMVRAAEVCGIAEADLDAFLALERSRHGLAKQTLGLTRAGLDPKETVAVKEVSELVLTSYSLAYWRQVGDAHRAGLAERQLRRQSKRAGVSAEDLLAHPPRLVQQRYMRPADADGRPVFGVGEGGWGQVKDSGIPDWSPKGPLRWWTHNAAAYLDLAYRGFPELIRSGLAAGKKTIRLWHVGFEDTSQTFVLAAMLDEAVRRMRKDDPRRVSPLDELKFEIVASDHIQRPSRQGDRFRFNDIQGVQHHPKTQLAFDEAGPKAARDARQRLVALERELDMQGPDLRENISTLLKAGKLAQAMEQLLEVDHRIALTRGDISFAYRLRPDTWRVDDEVGGGTINAKVAKRRIRFVTSDLTKESAVDPGTADLVVSTYVLAYLSAYGGKEENVPKASANLQRGAAPHAPLLLEGTSAYYLQRVLLPNGDRADQEERASTVAPQKAIPRVWITREDQVEEVALEDFRSTGFD